MIKRSLFILVLAWLLPACALATGKQDLTFSFPDASQGDTEDENGVWHGTREYTGERGAKITYARGACVGLISTMQAGDRLPIPGTDVPVRGTGTLKLTVQGPCTSAYQVTIIPAE